MNKILYLILGVFIVISIHAQENLKIAIVDLKPNNISSKEASTISDLLRTEIINSGLFVVIERSQLDEVMNEQGLQMTGLIDSEDAAEVGMIMAIDKILLGEAGLIGSKLVVSIRIVDVEKGISEFSASVEASSLSQANQAVKKLTSKLINEITDLRKNILSVRILYDMPIGSMANILSYGIGGMIDFSIPFPNIENLSLGMNLGAHFFGGKTAILNETILFPVYINTSYNLPVLPPFSVTPKLAMGYSISSSTIADGTDGGGNPNYISQIGYNPVGMAGLELNIDLSNDFFLYMAGYYNLLFEQTSIIQYISIGAGGSIKL
jgi:hypothetical protein